MVLYESATRTLDLSVQTLCRYKHKQNYIRNLDEGIIVTGLRINKKPAIKEVRCNCSAHRSAHLFIITISSHSHIKRKQPQRIFLQYSCSVTMIDIVKNVCEGKFTN